MKRGKFWKFYLAFFLLFLVLSQLSAESETELKIPDLEMEATYEIQGKDLITLYTTINDLNETKTEYKNLTTEMMGILNDAKTLAQEYEKENKKLQLQNNFLIGTTVFSVSVCVSGVITFMCLNTK